MDGVEGLLLAAGGRRERCVERRRVDRLHQVFIEAGRLRPLLVLALSVAGQSDETHAGQFRCGSKSLREFVAIHDRETDVQQPTQARLRAWIDRGARALNQRQPNLERGAAAKPLAHIA